MSKRTLPLLFFNLGGEMLYVLHQRLHAQNVLAEKANKVMEDVVTIMFSEQWLEELFRPQTTFSVDGLKVLFMKVAHSSIMRLNNIAMEKLYDLMSMSFKYQLLACPRPEDVILVTLNHLDALKTLVSESRACCEAIHAACRKLNEHYSPLSKAEFIVLRSAMLSLLQDSHRRISVLLRQKLQRQSGAFVLPVGGPVPVGMEIPGAIRYYSEDGDICDTDHFNPIHCYTPATKQGSWEVIGDRVTELGCNIYTRDAASQCKHKPASPVEPHSERPREGVEPGVRVHRKLDEDEDNVGGATANDSAAVNAELTLLQKLLVKPLGERGATFKLNLFPELDLEHDDDVVTSGGGESERESKNKGSVLQLETQQQGKDELNKVRDDLTITDTGSCGDDWLDLMDQAVA